MRTMRAKISRGGQISVPAPVRHRWRAEAVVIEDHGDHLVVRPEEDDPIARVRGAFAEQLRGTSSDEMRRENREVELEREIRRYGDG